MTSQIREILILDGKQTSMPFCPPLPEARFLARTERIHNGVERDHVTHYEVIERWVDAAGRSHEAAGSPIIDSTACWRGYQGTWALAERKFYLTGLEGRVRLAVEGPLVADWFTGVLRIGQGRMLTYVHMGFGSVYEKELHIFVEQGIERGRRTLRNKPGEVSESELAVRNLPGFENRFKGDRDFH